MPLLMIGWKHWNPEQLGLALRQEIPSEIKAKIMASLPTFTCRLLLHARSC